MKNRTIGYCCAGCVAAAGLLYSQAARRNTDWRVYNGSPGGSHYSSLKQINQTNVGRLQVAWSFDAGDGPGTLETNSFRAAMKILTVGWIEGRIVSFLPKNESPAET